MKKILATLTLGGIALFGAAACTSAQKTSSPPAKPTATVSAPYSSWKPYTPQLKQFAATFGFDETCAIKHIEAAYPTPGEFVYDTNTIGSDAMAAKTGIRDCRVR